MPNVAFLFAIVPGIFLAGIAYYAVRVLRRGIPPDEKEQQQGVTPRTLEALDYYGRAHHSQDVQPEPRGRERVTQQDQSAEQRPHGEHLPSYEAAREDPVPALPEPAVTRGGQVTVSYEEGRRGWFW